MRSSPTDLIERILRVFFFFFQNSLSFFCHHFVTPSYHKLKKFAHWLTMPLMFKEEQGVAATWRFTKQHKVQHLQEDMKTKYVFYIFFFCTRGGFFGFRLMFIFALLVFRVHQCLDSILTSFAFRWLKLVTTIVAKSTIVGTMLFEWMLLEQHCLNKCC